MIAYAMNGQPLPLLNGFPLRLVVPGWYSTYWVKMLNDIEVLDHPDDNFWMSKAYLIPDTPQANITPGQTGVKMVPINRMVPRSFFTNLTNGQNVPPASRKRCAASPSAETPACATSACRLTAARPGCPRVLATIMANTASGNGKAPSPFPRGPLHPDGSLCEQRWRGAAQWPNWNPTGFMRNVIESTPVVAS